MVAKFAMALAGALVAVPAWAGDAPRLSAVELAAQVAPAKSGEMRYCRPARDAEERDARMRCATRAQWRELGVSVAKR